MPDKTPMEEVGDLFVTETALTLKLMPSRKSGSLPIRWFASGSVTNARAAAKDIQVLVGKLQGRNKVVKRLNVTTDKGRETDLTSTGLSKAVAKAGFIVL